MYGVKIIPSPSDKVPSPRLAYQAPQKWGIALFSLFLTIFFLGASAEGVTLFHSSGKRMHQRLVLQGAAWLSF